MVRRSVPEEGFNLTEMFSGGDDEFEVERIINFPPGGQLKYDQYTFFEARIRAMFVPLTPTRETEEALKASGASRRR